MEKLDDNWVAFISWCKDNPFTTIERLEIVNGKPNIIVTRKLLTPITSALIKIRYNKDVQGFSKK